MADVRRLRPRGLFLSFEGIDGSGKSTQARLLADALTKAGHDVLSVREPGGTPLGERIRSLLLDPSSQISDRAETLLFAAARAQVVEHVIEPALNAGRIVVADRYVDSTIAYQGGGRGLPASLAELNTFATGGLLPDRTYLVDVAVSTADSRRVALEADRMEQQSVGFRERVATAYRRVSDQSRGRMLVLDGSRPAEAVHQIILHDVLGRLEAFL